jgi:hypothetical protein
MRDTIDLIREAGIDEWWSSGGEVRETFDEYLKTFAELVRADEREACAKLCDTTPPYPFRPSIEAAHAIRARGNT